MPKTSVKPQLPQRAESGNGTAPTSSNAALLRDWLANPELLQPPEIVLPYLAVEGRVTLLSGREKVGKSTLTGCAIAAASAGNPVLGVRLVAPITCLWYALDEPVGDTVRRFSRLGADVDNIAINDKPRTIGQLLAALESDLAAFEKVDLVVLDTLSRVLAFSGVDPNSKREVGPFMAPLVDFFHRTNTSAVLLYHTGKGGREYSGNVELGASVDEVLTIRKRGQTTDEDDFNDDVSDDGRRLLVQDGRNLRGRVQLNTVDGVYQLYEDPNPPKSKIVGALRDHGSVNGRAELAKLAGVRKETGLLVIRSLIADKTIIERGRSLRLNDSYGSHSSQRFPPEGTAAEPVREPSPPALNLFGSRARNPHPAGSGTEDRGEAWEGD